MVGFVPPNPIRERSATFPCSAIVEAARTRFTVQGAITLEPMVGGASTRSYARVTWAGGHSAVAMFVPEATRSEEVSQESLAGRRWPFLEIAQLLTERGVSVPRILHEACDQGFILLEDLGNTTLAARLCSAPEQKLALYQRAVRDLAHAQRALEELPDTSIIRTRAFDSELLRWEIDHFREWALEARGIGLDRADRSIFDQAATHLATTIAGFSRGFVHRDYQSRNLMVVDAGADQPKLVWIDFQDALLGPRVYDLVALLGDSYQTFDRPFIEARLDEFCTERGWGHTERAQLGHEFDMVTVQRKLKDAGRFVFIDRVKQNPSYLGFVEPTIGKVRAALERLREEPTLVALHALLARVLH